MHTPAPSSLAPLAPYAHPHPLLSESTLGRMSSGCWSQPSMPDSSELHEVQGGFYPATRASRDWPSLAERRGQDLCRESTQSPSSTTIPSASFTPRPPGELRVPYQGALELALSVVCFLIQWDVCENCFSFLVGSSLLGEETLLVLFWLGFAFV